MLHDPPHFRRGQIVRSVRMKIRQLLEQILEDRRTLQRLTECDVCGAVVSDKRQHSEFHAELAALAVAQPKLQKDLEWYQRESVARTGTDARFKP